jgi:hypothetical protein
MVEEAISIGPKFWLHVPLQTMQGKALRITGNGQLTVLGYTAKLHQRRTCPLPGAGLISIDRWLIFDPLPKTQAEVLLCELRLRLRVLSLRHRVTIVIPDSALTISPLEHAGCYNGPIPTLIQETTNPQPAWVDVGHTSLVDSKELFEVILPTCPAVEDERIISAIELGITSRYDTLPRSIFLSQLTIIDSLATRIDRSATTQRWLDEKIEEAAELMDTGLLSSLANLKQESHGSAVRELVGRAARALGADEAKVTSRQKLVNDLYRVRSGLSHAGGTSLNSAMLDQARELATLVIDAAIRYPAVLDANLFDAFRHATKMFDEISEKDYNLPFGKVLEDTDERHRSHRVRHLAGVAMKRDFSKIVPEKSGEVPHKWKIDPGILATTPEPDHWGLQILGVYPGREPGETPKKVALRLHRETLLARAFIQSLHEYICKDGPTRARVKQIMKEIGLKEISECATPGGLIKIGAGSLYAFLLPVMPFVPATGIAVATIVICCVGLDAICRTSREPASRP